MSKRFPRLEQIDDTVMGRLSLAAELLESGHLKAALEEADAGLRENPELAEAHYLKGLILSGRNELRAAESSLNDALELDAGRSVVWMTLADVLTKLDQFDEALAAVERALSLEADAAQAHVLRGDLLCDLGRCEEAITSYRNALAYDDRVFRAHCQLGRLLLEKGDAPGALVHAREAVQLNAEDVDSRMVLGDVLRHRGAYEAAIEEYREAVRLTATPASAYARIGMAYLEADLPTDAMVALNMAVGFDPSQPDCYDTLGRIYRDQGRDREADEMFAKARALRSQESGAMFHK